MCWNTFLRAKLLIFFDVGRAAVIISVHIRKLLCVFVCVCVCVCVCVPYVHMHVCMVAVGMHVG